MSNEFGSAPKFPGELSEHLPPGTPEPPDRLADRVRAAWFTYLVIAFAVLVWVGAAIAVAVLDSESNAWSIAVLVVAIPVVVVTWRVLNSRDPVTNEKIDRRKR
jgi:hypothetical protein